MDGLREGGRERWMDGGRDGGGREAGSDGQTGRQTNNCSIFVRFPPPFTLNHNYFLISSETLKCYDL